MGLVKVGNGSGLKIYSIPHYLVNNSSTNRTMDAAGESIAFVGRICLETGIGTSKTISAAGGGKIQWRTSSGVTFANAGTNFRIGLQDIGATGIEDGTFDVYADLVGATDVIASSTSYNTAMEAGSKTIAHGDWVAVCFEMTTRGGTDSVVIGVNSHNTVENTSLGSTYLTQDSGAGPLKVSTNSLGAMIEFDDGTVGWLGQYPIIPSYAPPTMILYGNSSSPDEYGASFKLPYKCTINSALFMLGAIVSTDTFECVIYSDPTGTPSIVQTITATPANVPTNGTLPMWLDFNTEVTIQPDTWYGITIRPTSTNSIQFGYHNLGAGNGKWKAPFDFGRDISLIQRTNQTGAFTIPQDYFIPVFGLQINKLDTGRKEHAASF